MWRWHAVGYHGRLLLRQRVLPLAPAECQPQIGAGLPRCSTMLLARVLDTCSVAALCSPAAGETSISSSRADARSAIIGRYVAAGFSDSAADRHRRTDCCFAPCLEQKRSNQPDQRGTILPTKKLGAHPNKNNAAPKQRASRPSGAESALVKTATHRWTLGWQRLYDRVTHQATGRRTEPSLRAPAPPHC